jgi:putative intracellular protease/amidase
MERVLLVVSSCREMSHAAAYNRDASITAKGGETGAWMEELAGSYYAFVDAGCNVRIGSPLGGEGPIDPLSLEDPWLTPRGRRFQSDPVAMGKLRETMALGAVHASEFDALYLVGGAAAAWDFPGDVHLAQLVQDLLAANRPVAGVCHGVLGLTGAHDMQGRPIVSGRAVTGVSNAEEVLTGFDKLVPVLPEARLKVLGGLYSCSAPFQEHVVSDGNVFTGQNPASAAPLALAVIASLRNRKRG